MKRFALIATLALLAFGFYAVYGQTPKHHAPHYLAPLPKLRTDAISPCLSCHG